MTSGSKGIGKYSFDFLKNYYYRDDFAKKKTTTKNFYVLSNYVVFTIVFCTSLIEIFNRNSMYITFTIAFLKQLIFSGVGHDSVSRRKYFQCIAP